MNIVVYGAMGSGKSEFLKVAKSLGLNTISIDNLIYQLYAEENNTADAIEFRRICKKLLNNYGLLGDYIELKKNVSSLFWENTQFAKELKDKTNEIILQRVNGLLKKTSEDSNLNIVEIPLFSEYCIADKYVDASVWIEVKSENQINRVIKRDSELLGKKRLEYTKKNLFPNIFKRSEANYIIENNGSADEFSSKVKDFLLKFQKNIKIINEIKKFIISYYEKDDAYELYHLIINSYNNLRFYHNLDHLAQLWEEIESLKKTKTISNTVLVNLRWITLFHDLVYQTDNEYELNEIKSAVLAKKWLSKINGLNVSLIVNAILATKGHVIDLDWIKESDPENTVATFLDIDLSILSKNEEFVDEFERNIRKEFIHVPLEVYKQKRIEVLKKIGEGDIFKTVHFIEKNDIAKKNILLLCEKILSGAYDDK